MGGAAEHNRPGSYNVATTTAETDSADRNGDDTIIPVIEIDQNDESINEPTRKLSKNQKKKLYNNYKRRNISVVFNSSNIILTEAMEKVLNRGLNFAILPLKLDLTQVLVDYERFERTMIWQEF